MRQYAYLTHIYVEIYIFNAYLCILHAYLCIFKHIYIYIYIPRTLVRDSDWDLREDIDKGLHGYLGLHN